MKIHAKSKHFLTKPFTRNGQKANLAFFGANLLDQNCTMWQEETQFLGFH